MTSNIASESSSLSAYELVLADINNQKETILNLWQAGLSHAGNPLEKLDWFYLHNPVLRPVLFLLRFKDEFVGVAALGCRRFLHSGLEINAGFVFDFVLNREHRGFFPALLLQRGVLKHAAQHYPLVFGIPNQKSRSVLERVGFRNIGKKVRYVRLIRCAPTLSRYLPSWFCKIICPIIDLCRHCSRTTFQLIMARPTLASWQVRADESFDSLWSAQSERDGLLGERDMAFLNWRFADCPLYEYRFFVIRSRHDHSLLAYAACRTEHGNLKVDDFLSVPSQASSLNQLWCALAIVAFQEGYETISVEHFSGSQRKRSPFGFIARDGDSFLATDTKAALSGTLECTWHVTAADEDV